MRQKLDEEWPSTLTKSWILLYGYNPDFCKLSWPWLFKRWMALSTGYITIHWIMLSVFSEQLRPEVHQVYFPLQLKSSLTLWIERYSFLITSYLTGLFVTFILLHIWQNSRYSSKLLFTRILYDGHHKDRHLIIVESWT